MSFQTVCWNCGSKRFQETVSREYCPDCGIECLYHGSGTNDKYDNAHRRLNERREIDAAQRLREYWGED